MGFVPVQMVVRRHYIVAIITTTQHHTIIIIIIFLLDYIWVHPRDVRFLHRFCASRGLCHGLNVTRTTFTFSFSDRLTYKYESSFYLRSCFSSRRDVDNEVMLWHASHNIQMVLLPVRVRQFNSYGVWYYNHIDNLLFIFFLPSLHLCYCALLIAFHLCSWQKCTLINKNKNCRVIFFFFFFFCFILARFDFVQWNLYVSITLIVGRKRIDSHKENCTVQHGKKYTKQNIELAFVREVGKQFAIGISSRCQQSISDFTWFYCFRL